MISNDAKALDVNSGYFDLSHFTPYPSYHLDVKHFFQSVKRSVGPAAVRNKWLTLALKGNTVHCPCCKRQFQTFVPTGLAKRANARCVGCDSLERHRTIWLYLNRKTEFFKKDLTVLNVAPEPFFYKKFSRLSNIKYFAIDKFPEEYGYGRKTIRMDVCDLKFADESFDVIICNHVLEHVPNDRKAMREMNRVLKPGGWAILNCPVNKNQATTLEDTSITDPAIRLELFGQQDHVRVYGRDYIDRLFDAGFEVNIVDYADTFTNNERFRYGMKAGEDIYHCFKK
ncbi:MAG TPA: methyltransferase domain-containing protein [Segetibacter sp.]|jgi:SAM-dependent methyltransferase